MVGPPLGSPVDEAEYSRVFAAMSQEGVDALIVGPGGKKREHAKIRATSGTGTRGFD
jgi:hypothetical protein